MMVVGAIGYPRGCFMIVAQILGGIAASGVVYGLQPGPLNVRTELGGGTSVVRGLFIEVSTCRRSSEGY
jgi:aquaporin rerated protein, other eukaryote